MQRSTRRAFRKSALALALSAAALVVGAEDKNPAVRTTTDAIRIPDTVVEFKLVKLPPGKVTIKDKDGKDKEVEVKPVWIGQYEVQWPEFDVFWQALDLPSAADREKAIKMTKTRPSIPYEPPDRVRADAQRARRLGFGGKLCIHPKQIAPVHEAFAPTEAELDWARRVHAAAKSAGGAAVALDGAMVDRPVILRAEDLLARDRWHGRTER